MRDQLIEKIVNTHSHEDHIGGNSPLQSQFPGLEIFAHPLTLPVLAEPRKKQPLHPYRRFMWGMPEASVGKPIADGEIISTKRLNFTVVFTPGHAPDHVCLYEPELGWLFSGDLFVGGKERALLAGAEIWEVISSLKKVVNLKMTRLFPGSARVRENPRRELQEKITRLEELGAQTLELHAKGWSVDAITRTLFGGPLLIELITLGHFSRRNLVCSYLRKMSLAE